MSYTACLEVPFCLIGERKEGFIAICCEAFLLSTRWESNGRVAMIFSFSCESVVLNHLNEFVADPVRQNYPATATVSMQRSVQATLHQ